ncbi:MAG: S8 family serine peptidase [Bacteroidota bacterium]
MLLKLHSNAPLFGSLFIIFSVLFLLSSFQLSSQDSHISGKNSLQWEELDLLNTNLDEIDYFLLESKSSVNTSNLSKMGFTLHRKLGDTKAIVSIHDQAKFRLNRVNEQYQYYTIKDDWKFAPNFDFERKGENITIWIGITDEKEFHNYISSQSKIKVILKRDHFYKIKLTSSQIEKLKSKAFINFIELAEVKPKSEATVLDLNLHPNRINALHHLYPDFDGSTQTIGIKEPFYDTEDIDISNRYISSGLESDFIDSHPLQMATIMVGNGNTFVTGKGVAPKAFHSSSTNENLIPNEDNYYNEFNINVQNHSYGTQIESFYGVEANLYDQNVYDLENVLHVFSSGNSGTETAQNGRYKDLEGFANITGNFKQSKNTLLVGAIDTAHNILEFISNGPAYDGRIKPELVAYSMAGSSNSAALVSGTSLLLSEFFQNQYDSIPSASLLKSVLINSADDVHLNGPDHKTGFGQLNALAAMKTIEENRFLLDQISENEIKELKINIPDGAINFKATLTWTDLPANPNDEIALVNDLDLKISNGSGAEFLPWVLDNSSSISALNNIASRGEDHLNNVEQVFIANPENSEIIFNINANDLASPFQKFSISYQWEMPNQFTWTSPTASDNIPYNGSTISHLRWESSYAEGTKGTLYFKIPEQQDWQLINDNIDLKEEQFRWDAPIFQDIAQLRMQVNEESYLSDTFTLSSPVELKTGFNCTDSLSIYWERISNATHYEVNHIINGEMINLATTQDSSLIIDKSLLESNILQLIPYKDEKPLIQSFSIDYNLQGSSCFLNSFFVEAVQDSGVLANLNLAALNGLNEVVLERDIGGNWNEIKTIKPETLSVKILDSEAETGFNNYRTVLYFNNGVRIYSEESSVYYVNESAYKVFPNPLPNGEDLRIFTQESDIPAVIYLLSSNGEVVYSKVLEDNRNYVELDEFKEGLYFYQILQESKIRQSGKILIQF